MSKITLYKITEARAPYWMKAPNLAVAAVAVLMIGNGRFGVKELGGQQEMPVFKIDGMVDIWSENTFGHKIDEVVAKVSAQWTIELRHALESIKLGEPGDSNFTRPGDGWDLEEDAQRLCGKIDRALVENLQKKRPHGAH